MKRFLALALAGAVMTTAFAGCAKKEEDVIKIGHVVALTGDNSAWGISEKKAIDMEIEKINAAGGVDGKKIQLIAYDSRADATEGVNVAQRLVSEGVTAILGPGQSGVAIAMHAVTEPSKVPFLATTATNPKVTVDENTGAVVKSAFRMCFIDPFQGTVAAQFAAKDLGLKTAAIIYDVGSDYSSFLGKYFAEAFEAEGGQILTSEAFRTGELDFRAVLGKIKDQNPECLFIPTQQKEASLIMKQAGDLGLKTQFIGGDSWATPDLVPLGGPATEGAYYVNIASLEDTNIQQFVKEFREKYNEDPVLPNPIMLIDGLYAVIDCIKQTGSTDPTVIMEQLEKVKDLQVLSGKLTIDPLTHNPLNKPAVIEKIQDGELRYHKTFVTE